MPFSDSVFNLEVASLIKNNNFHNYLDIGAGKGKYGRMVRGIKKDVKITAIEPDESYIKRFKLKSLYDKVINKTAEEFIEGNPDYLTEMVIIGDCLEHLKKSDGLDLIHFFVYRSKMIVVIFPSKYIQLSWQGHKLEAHRSVWSKEDFEQFDNQYLKKGHTNMVIIRGYLADPEALAEISVKKQLGKQLGLK